MTVCRSQSSRWFPNDYLVTTSLQLPNRSWAPNRDGKFLKLPTVILMISLSATFPKRELDHNTVNLPNEQE